jgi:hypothetical protein
LRVAPASGIADVMAELAAKAIANCSFSCTTIAAEARKNYYPGALKTALNKKDERMDHSVRKS